MSHYTRNAVPIHLQSMLEAGREREREREREPVDLVASTCDADDTPAY